MKSWSQGFFLFNLIYGLSNLAGSTQAFITPFITDHILLLALSIIFLIRTNTRTGRLLLSTLGLFITFKTLDDSATHAFLYGVLDLQGVSEVLKSNHANFQVLIKLALVFVGAGYLYWFRLQFISRKSWPRYLPLIPLGIIIWFLIPGNVLDARSGMIVSLLMAFTFGLYHVKSSETDPAFKRYTLTFLCAALMLSINMIFFLSIA